MTPFAFGYSQGLTDYGRWRIRKRLSFVRNKRYAELVELGILHAIRETDPHRKALSPEEGVELLKLLNEETTLMLPDIKAVFRPAKK
jgi:hypothetical protein